MTASTDTPAGSTLPRRRSPRRVLDAALNAVLNLAAVGGALCIVLVILALVLDISLILFRTGSMSPAIPQGAIAVVREIPAAEIAVGDVVTVDREGELPITHRVTSVAPAGGPERTITLQGDANPAPDPEPYTVTSVRKVLFAVPGLARPIAALSSPYVLGGMTLFVTALVVWSLWPRRTLQEYSQDPARTSTGSGDGEADTAQEHSEQAERP